ncbi:probable 26S proteasome non-ATPase regulatory subunit 3 [Tanacetum coccineum]
MYRKFVPHSHQPKGVGSLTLDASRIHDAKDPISKLLEKPPLLLLVSGFKATRGAIIVRNNVSREIPERTVFMQKGMEKALRPYFELTNFCRYLFYLGNIRTIQLEYTDAKESLLQAARKAPIAALDFRAVRIGDLELFKTTAEKFSSTFSTDRTNNLIVRLRHNVIRTGLRNISISYSRISLADVATKLRLDSPNPVADAESIVSKAIRDGAIDATIDHANGLMLSKETGDIYSTNEPQMAFNSRIAFCLNMHNEAVRALRFPPNSHKEKESAEKRRERQQQEQELAQHIAEEDADDY